MTEFASLVISVDSRQVVTAEKRLMGMESAGSAAFKKLAVTAAAYLGTRQVIQYADAYTSLTNRLKLVTDGSVALANATDDVFQIAQRSRAAISATGDLYFKVAQNADKLGLSSHDVASVTETVTQALAISGASAQASEAAILQLSQALASGAIRGDEFNAVAENAPALMDALSRSLGVTKGELRSLAAEGKLTSEVLIRSLQEQADEIATAFGKTDATISQSFQSLENSVTMFVGQMNDATGASTSLANSVIELSHWIDEGHLLDGIIATTATWGATIDDVIYGVQSLNADLSSLQDTGEDTASFLTRAFVQMPANVSAAVKISAIEVSHFFSVVGEGLIVTGTRLKELDDLRKDSIDQVLKERDAQVNAGKNAVQSLQDQRKAHKELRQEQELSATIDSFVRDKNRKSAAEMLASATGKEKKGKKAKDSFDYSASGLHLSELDDIAAAEEESNRRFIATQQERLIGLKIFLGAQTEAARTAYIERQFVIDNAYSMSDEAQLEAQALSLASYNQYQNDLTQIAISEAQRRMDLDAQVLSSAGNLANNLVDFTRTIGAEQSLMGRAFFATSKAIQVGMAFINAEASAASVLAGYSAMAAVSGPAAPAVIAQGIGMSNLVRGLGYASAAAIAATGIAEISGGRALGGQVQAGRSYMVGERGPELFTPGNRGNITTNEKLKSSQGGTGHTTIINQTSARIDSVEEKTYSNGDRILILKEATDAVASALSNPNSSVSKSLSRNYAVQRSRS